MSAPPTAASAPTVELRGIVKRYGAVVALDGADLVAYGGQVQAILGENGAGKSTLAGVLAGSVRPDRGEILVQGTARAFRSPTDAVDASIGIVHQHFKLVPALTGLENIALGAVRRLPGLRLRLDRVRSRAAEIIESVGLDVRLDAPVERMSVGERQRVEIVKLLFTDPRILVLDEPTAVLTPGEVNQLIATLRGLAGEGRTVLVIAHKLDEVLALADRVTVLRRGRTVLAEPRQQVDGRRLARAMVGEDAGAVPTPSPARPGVVVAALESASTESRRGGPGLRDVSLEVRRGEIVGVAGVEGNGQADLADALAGFVRPRAGAAELPDRISLIPQDRVHEGLIADFSVSENIALGFHDDERFRRGPMLRWRAIEDVATAVVERFDVKVPGIASPVRTLSGGNQQKLAVGREVMRSPSLVIADNPTRGLDIRATRFVRSELLRLRDQDDPPGILLISTDLDEVLELAGTLYVLVRGRLVPVPPEARSRVGIGSLMLGTAT